MGAIARSVESGTEGVKPPLRLVDPQDAGMAGGLVQDAIIDAHLKWMGWKNQRPGTIEQRRLTLARLARHSRTEPAYVTTSQIADFRDRLTREGRPLMPQSQGAELAHLRSFFKWLVIEELRDDDPTTRVPRPKLPKRLPNPIPEHLMSEAIRTSPERVAPWYLLAGYAGLRACEVAPLRADDLWWHHSPPLIHVRDGKGGVEGHVPISPVLEPILRGLPKRGYLFAARDGKLGPVKPWTVSQLGNNHLHSIGILHHTFHSFRHRFGTQLYRLTKDLRQTQELMRHASPSSTAGYTAVDVTEAAGIVAALPAVG